MKTPLLLGFILLTLPFSLRAQKQMLSIKPSHKIICYGSKENTGLRLKNKINNNSKNKRTQAADVVVDYNGFSPEAQAAFQQAIDIWANTISSPVPIYIDASWLPLDEGVLGSAIWGTAYSNFDGALRPNTWYPVALAEKMANRGLNKPGEPDIVANFSSSANWYLSLDGDPSAGQYDFVTVVLHEIGHGLGFVDSFGHNEDEDNPLAAYGLSASNNPGTYLPFIYDTYLKNNTGDILIDDFANPSSELAEQVTSNSVFFDSPINTEENGQARIYAPSEWNSGSSIAHLNESTYNGTENSLMTPFIAMDEVMQDPGPLMLGMFGDMGWEYVYIEPERPNTEDIVSDTYTITAHITGDIGYFEDRVSLYYSTDGFSMDSTEIMMEATGGPNEFSAEVPSLKTLGQSYAYYILVPDSVDRPFRYPSLRHYDVFTSDTDEDAPLIAHTPPNFIRVSDNTLILEAMVKDFLPVDVMVNYSVNNVSMGSSPMVLTDEIDSIYTATIDLTPFDLEGGDSLSYTIFAEDMSLAMNSTVDPESGEYVLAVISLLPTQEYYFNDFNDLDSARAQFFSSNNFAIETVDGFENGALHSDHPYQNGSGANSESNYVIEMRVPVLLNEEGYMAFDEIALIEPGVSGSGFGSSDFFDYVVVEGSADGGLSWLPFEEGYDSRAETDWLNTYNSDIDEDDNSVAGGSAGLFRSREIEMLNNEAFSPGDEILIRFRLFADQLVNGWGWAIDNLKIQIDETPPAILHDHHDFITTADSIVLDMTVTDNVGLDSLAVLWEVAGVPQETVSFSNTNGENYRVTFGLENMQPGDTLKYRIVAADNNKLAPNFQRLPSDSTAWFYVPYVELKPPVNEYSQDFEGENEDFVGNFFSVRSENDFLTNAIHSYHTYPENFGLNGHTDFTYTLLQPIRVSEIQHVIAFDEVLIAPSSTYAYVEASKDRGATWLTLAEYNVSDESLWVNAYNTDRGGDQTLMINRIVNFNRSNEISPGDEVIVRFRLNTNSATAGWGWAIDNLEIQTDKINSIIDAQNELRIVAFPNPVGTGTLKVNLRPTETLKSVKIDILDRQGKHLVAEQLFNVSDEVLLEYDFSNRPAGLYIARFNIDGETYIKKILRK